MSDKPFIEQLREFVDEQTRNQDSVSNLTGFIPNATLGTRSKQQQQFWASVVTVPTGPLDHNAVYKAFTFENPGVEPLDAVDGSVQFPKSGATIPSGKAVLLFGIAKIRNKGTFSVSALGESSTISVYINGNQIGTGPDALDASMELSNGLHEVALLFHGAINPVTADFARDVEIVRSEATPLPPMWVDTPKAYLLDTVTFAVTVGMAWDNGAKAASWNLYRAEASQIGNMTSTAPTTNADGTITFIMDTRVSLRENDHLFTEFFDIGTVVRTEFPGTSNTSVVIRPSLDMERNFAFWPFNKVLIVGNFAALASVPNAGQSVVSYMDHNIRSSGIYLYKVTAVSALGSVESEFSPVRWVFAADLLPPQGIDWNSEFPPEISIVGSTVTIDFLTPPDIDFAGVNVYGPYPLVGGLAVPPDFFDIGDQVVHKLSTPNHRDQVSFSTGDSGGSVFYVATFDASGNEQPPITPPIASLQYRNPSLVHGAYPFVFDGPNTDGSLSLSVITIPFDTLELDEISYLGSGVVTMSANGEPFGTPPGSPFIVFRGLVSQVFVFKVTSGGQFMTASAYVPSKFF